MKFNTITSFPGFCTELRKAGFSMAGNNGEGIFSLCNYFADHILWHTGNQETDPWEWRIRGIMEGKDIAYGKVFLNKAGWITKEWYPYFLAVRRGHKTFDEMYYDGLVSITSKKIYDCIQHIPHIPLNEVQLTVGYEKEDKSIFESALTDLQMKMFITISGQKYKISQEGKEYGWPAITYCDVEDFFEEDVFNLSCQISPQEAAAVITERILDLNPEANRKAINKFIGI